MRLQPWLATAVLPLLAAAVPSSTAFEDISSPNPPPHVPATWRLTNPLRLARDWMIEAITMPTASNPTAQPDPSTAARCHSASPEQRALLAQYGSELVLRFNTTTAADANALLEACDNLFLDVWGRTSAWTDVRLAKDVVPSLLGLLPQSLQHAHTPLMQPTDLVRAIEASYEPSDIPSAFDDATAFAPRRHRTSDREHSVFFSQYRSWSVIVPWMRLMESMFSTHVRLITVGKTYEGRDIHGLRIGVRPTNAQRPLGPRKTILITAGLHAREWISTSTATYIAYRLITDYGRSSLVTDMVEQYDWVVLPSLNPDGYAYTWNSDRLWRKNRQPTSLRFCNGVDLDRSFGFMWNGDSTASNPCSESYAGESPFDGIEAAQLANWMKIETEMSNTQFISLFDLHSYAQEVLYPYSYSCADDPPTLENLEEMGEGFAKAIRANGHIYSVLQACEGNVTPLSNPAGGSLLDWVYHELQVKVAYQFKLRDRGSWGFLLPREYIVPVGDELFDAVLFLGSMLTRGDSAVVTGESLPHAHASSQGPAPAQKPMLAPLP